MIHLSPSSGQWPVLFLVRHGETDYNRKKIFQGRTDNPLNPEGIIQARSIAELLKPVPFTRAYSSPLIRAKTTTEAILSDRDIPLKVESRLIELDFGDWEGVPEVEVKEHWMNEYMDYRTDMGSFHPSGGESAVEAQYRAGEWWDEVSEQYNQPGEHILVVAHQSINAVLACYITGKPLIEAWEIFKAKPCEIIKIVPTAISQVSRIMPEMGY